MIDDRATDVRWRAPDVFPRLDDGGVHVWSARISELARLLHELRGTLSPEERERASRFHFAEDRARYTVAHAATRLIIGAYAAVPISALEFADGEFGKPRLSKPLSVVAIEFNLSHSGDHVALAVSRAGPVGIDVERHTHIPDLLELSEHCFSVAERVALRDLANGSRTRAFFDCWSRKEAYIKATGLGVSSGLDHFDVALTPEVARLLADRSPHGDPARWEMFALDFADGYSGAIVVPRAADAPARFRLTARTVEALLADAVGD